MNSYFTLMPDASEIVAYDAVGIPLYIQTDHLSTYPDMRALCHWHEDIEFIRIQKGHMNYFVNGRKILLHENDCIMINARQMHYGYSSDRQECVFTCILFHPQLLAENALLHQKYVLPIIQNSHLEYLFLHEEVAAMDRMVQLKEQALPGYELEVIGILHILWSNLLRRDPFLSASETAMDYSDLTIQKNMVSFINQHYSEKLALADIAAAGSVCRSKCCSMFKHYLQQSPIDFLNCYRLEVSCRLLKNTNRPITEIATACGFNHLSYYSKLFLRNYGCTPSDYRKHSTLIP